MTNNEPISSTERMLINDRVSIRIRGKKRIYVAEFHELGQHRRVSLKTPNKKVAFERAMKIAASLMEGSYKPTITPVSISEVSDHYLAFLQTEGRARKTLVKYRGVLDLFLGYLHFHKVTMINQLMPGHLDRYRAERKKTRHEKTLYTEAVIFKQFTKWARSRRYIVEDPFIDVKIKKPILTPKPSPTIDEVRSLLALATPTLRAKLSVLAYTGMRSGELQRLRPDDVDLKGNWIHIVSRAGAETKTRRSRKVPIHPCLLTVFQSLEKRNRPWLFTSAPSRRYPEGNQPMNCKRLNEQFQRLVKKLGMTGGRKDGYVIHSLRHFFETFTVNNNIPQRVIDTWLGHHGDKSMGAVYYRLSDEDSQKFMRVVPFDCIQEEVATPIETSDNDTES